MQRERGLVVIIAYKFGKGALWLVLALSMTLAMRMGLGDHIRGLADHLQHHAHAWSLRLAELLVRASTPRGLWTVIVALVADGISSFIEGWALYRGRWWGPWLVVVATAALLPFEIIALSRHPHVVRAVLFILNIAIVVYLARQALREHRRAKSMGSSPVTPAPETTPDPETTPLRPPVPPGP